MENFEKELIEINKPQVSERKQLELLENAIRNAKDRSVVSWWWLIIPAYLIAAFLMKAMYMPHTTLVSSLHDYANKTAYLSLFLLLIVPVLIIVINTLSIRRVYLLLQRRKITILLIKVWSNLIVILFSAIVLLIYSI